ncbi:MAG: RNA polymerase subunit sigma [Phycisphaeraceae bacterium]|nr:RNA polymerase subunit sigma [Phycisphaeraceae bacterium]
MRQGSSDGWSQLLQRYQGRLLSFARGQMRDRTEAEDAVQETFLSFLQGLGSFRGEAGIETWLFGILRRRIVDVFRGSAPRLCLMHDQDGGDAAADVAGHEPTASWYARREEDHQGRYEALGGALSNLIGELKQEERLRDLEVADLIFYAQVRNQAAAERVGIDPKRVALLKHRWLQRIRRDLGADGANRGALDEFDVPVDLLTRIWEARRLSCPKRSTIGSFELGALEPPWRDYVAFHLGVLGCRFCLANRDDLRAQSNQGTAARALRERIMQSTIGFWKDDR